jgi:hypothetical protein
VTLGLAGVYRLFSHMGDDLVTEAPTVAYEELERRRGGKGATGDLLLTSNTLITSSPTKIGTRSPWTHCGILYVNEQDNNSLFEWGCHSGREGILNSRGERGFRGAQLVPLPYLMADNGCAFWRPVEMSREDRQKIKDVVARLDHKIDFVNVAEFGAVLGGPFERAFNGFSPGMACSHLVAATYMAAGVIANDRHITQFLPQTFAATPPDDDGAAQWLVDVSPHIYQILGAPDGGGLIRVQSPKRKKRENGEILADSPQRVWRLGKERDEDQREERLDSEHLREESPSGVGFCDPASWETSFDSPF